jgi:hypothetical protein
MAKVKKRITTLNGIKCWVSRKGKVCPTNWKIAALMLGNNGKP